MKRFLSPTPNWFPAHAADAASSTTSITMKLPNGTTLKTSCVGSANKTNRIMRDKDSKKKTVKVMGPWVDGVRSVKEIPLEEWTSYTPLNRRVQGEWFRVVGW